MLFLFSDFLDNKIIEALIACEPDTLTVFMQTPHAVDTDQRVLGQLSDLYDRELVGIIGKYYYCHNFKGH